VYVAGCPPRPDNLLNALMKIQEKVQRGESRGMSPAYVGDVFKAPEVPLITPVQTPSSNRL
jgi:NADH:ubiquinone oxidoreductase subunit B-like Fe-S oxidoreductase